MGSNTSVAYFVMRCIFSMCNFAPFSIFWHYFMGKNKFFHNFKLEGIVKTDPRLLYQNVKRFPDCVINTLVLMIYVTYH